MRRVDEERERTGDESANRLSHKDCHSDRERYREATTLRHKVVGMRVAVAAVGSAAAFLALVPEANALIVATRMAAALMIATHTTPAVLAAAVHATVVHAAVVLAPAVGMAAAVLAAALLPAVRIDCAVIVPGAVYAMRVAHDASAPLTCANLPTGPRRPPPPCDNRRPKGAHRAGTSP
jgi:hypothetical protein